MTETWCAALQLYLSAIQSDLRRQAQDKSLHHCPGNTSQNLGPIKVTVINKLTTTSQFIPWKLGQPIPDDSSLSVHGYHSTVKYTKHTEIVSNFVHD